MVTPQRCRRDWPQIGASHPGAAPCVWAQRVFPDAGPLSVLGQSVESHSVVQVMVDAGAYDASMRDITQPPDADRRRRTLVRSTVLHGASAVAIAAVLILAASMEKPITPLVVGASVLLLMDVAWFIWGLQRMRNRD